MKRRWKDEGATAKSTKPCIIEVEDDEDDDVIYVGNSCSNIRSKQDISPSVLDASLLGFYSNAVGSLQTVGISPVKHGFNALNIKDVLYGDYNHVLLMNYMYDMEWLLSECPRILKVGATIIHGERDEASFAEVAKAFPQLKIVKPSLPIPYGTHHTKMMMIFYATGIRMVITTANFLQADWENKTQGIWLYDFPLKNDSCSHHPDVMALDFVHTLKDYLSSLGKHVQETYVHRLNRYDFSCVPIMLVCSIPGYHKGTGNGDHHLAIERLTVDFKSNLAVPPLRINKLFASLGSIDEKWLLGEFCTSLTNEAIPSTSLATDLRSKALHLIWPSSDQVKNSVEGWAAGGSLPCTTQNMKPFLFKFLRKWNPTPMFTHCMPHIKSYCQFQQDETTGVARLDWVILTSANLSKAAWGSWQKKGEQLMIRSYEVGVLCTPKMIQEQWKSIFSSAAPSFSCTPQHPVLHPRSCQPELLVSIQHPRVSFTLFDAKSSIQSNSSDEGIYIGFSMPFQLPLDNYNFEKGDRPWIWNEQHLDVDRFGRQYKI